MPEKLHLAAYFADGNVQAYPLSRMPAIDAEHSISNLPGLHGEINLMSFSIFSGDMQYGIFICEADIEKSVLMHIIGLQLGILINFLELKQKEKIVGNELENIRERNEILNFLSEYDSQCSILNRRGFIERAIRLNRENVGKHAICVFMDLDHLKEINDTFGHSQGDVALVAVSDILKQAVRNNDLVARIGGDEFVGMFLIDTPEYDKLFKARLKKHSRFSTITPDCRTMSRRRSVSRTLPATRGWKFPKSSTTRTGTCMKKRNSSAKPR